MQFSKNFAFAAALLLIGLSACQDMGKDYKADKEHNVLYKGEGLAESDAKKLADFLKDQKYFTDGHPATVQIIKTKEGKDTVTINFVYDPKLVDADREEKFRSFGSKISGEVFNKAPLNIHLVDEKYKEFKNIGIVTAKKEEAVSPDVVNNGNQSGNEEVDPSSTAFPALKFELNGSKLYYNEAAAGMVPKLQQFLKDEQDFFNPSNPVDIVFFVRGNNSLLKLPFRKEVLADEATMQKVESLVDDLDKKVFPGMRATIWACDLSFNKVHAYGDK